MDFRLSDEQEAIAELAAQILRDHATPERQRQIEKEEPERFDRALHAKLAEAGLLGLAIAEEHGGAGLGFLEVAAVLEQIGRHTAPAPLFECAVLGAAPIVEFGSEAMREAWLPGIARGEKVVTAALVGDAPVRADRAGQGVTLTGTRLFVPAGPIADAILVPAELGDAPGFYLVEPSAAGVTQTSLLTTSRQPESKLELASVAVGADARLGADVDTIRRFVEERATAGLCMMTLGVCSSALALTAEYTKTRKQFDQPIAMFQAVGHRAADAYIDTETVRLSAWQAAWRVSEGLEAAKQLAIAKLFAAEGSKRVVHAAQHLHGGVGVDREYPLHRTFLYARQMELTLGGTPTQLRNLGKLLAAEARA